MREVPLVLSTPAVQHPVGEVVRGARLDGLHVVPFKHVQPRRLMQVLRSVLPDVPLRRSAQGVRLGYDAAARLKRAEPVPPLLWSSGAARFVHNRERIRRLHPTALAGIRRLRSEGLAHAIELLPSAESLDRLDGHQVVNVVAMTLPGHAGLCLFDEQGAGKTVSMIFAFDELVRRDETDFMLIVAPKSMVGEWPNDFARFTGDLYRVVVVSGSSRQKRAALHAPADVIVTNFETTISLEAELEALLRSHEGRSIIAVDESFFIKSPDTQRTLSLRRLREWSDRAFVLCGTPAPNSPVDLVEQFNFVDFGLTFDGVVFPDDRAEALPIVQAAVEERGLFIRNLKAQVLPELPAKAFHRVLVDLQPRQAQLYEHALRVFVEDLRKASDEQFNRKITNFLSQRAMLLQICSNPAAVTDGYDETPAKLAALDRLVEQFVVRQNEKLIVWSFYTGTIHQMMARYAKYGAVRYDGTVSSVGERRDAVKRFQEDSATRMFIANPAAAGAGLTLHRARRAVYESMSNQAAHYLQSLDRIHRRGQARPVEYIVLLGRDTIEEREYERLLTKEASAQQLLGDVVEPPVQRTSMLEEAVALLTRFSSHATE